MQETDTGLQATPAIFEGYGADGFKWLKGGELFSSGSWVQENDREGGVSKPFPFGFRCRENHYSNTLKHVPKIQSVPTQEAFGMFWMVFRWFFGCFGIPVAFKNGILVMARGLAWPWIA